MSKMLKFVDLKRETPEKFGSESRKENFLEIYKEFIDTKAKEQASRCSQCGVPYCQSHCPLHNNIPDWLKLTAEGRLQEAYEASQATNAFPEICGRICPQDRLCEGNCVIEQSGHETVTIGAIEKYITDTAWEEGWVKAIMPQVLVEKSVGIIGAGPGGLAAAERLRREGFEVTVYDRYDRAGGLLTYGIPGFKLEKNIVQRRNNQLEESERLAMNAAYKIVEKEKDKIAAVILEPLVQGAGGMKICRKEFLDKLVKVFKDSGILVIFDEVMTGFGRTGKMFATDHLTMKPDIICLAKSLTGGFIPLAATVFSEEIHKVFVDTNFNKTFLHGHSFSANPVACAAALSSLNLFNEDKTFTKIEEISKIHNECLKKISKLQNISKIQLF